MASKFNYEKQDLAAAKATSKLFLEAIGKKKSSLTKIQKDQLAEREKWNAVSYRAVGLQNFQEQLRQFQEESKRKNVAALWTHLYGEEILPPLEDDDGSQSEHNGADDEQVGEMDGGNHKLSGDLDAEGDTSDAHRNGGGNPESEESNSEDESQSDSSLSSSTGKDPSATVSGGKRKHRSKKQSAQRLEKKKKSKKSQRLRKKLQKLNTEELFQELQRRGHATPGTAPTTVLTREMKGLAAGPLSYSSVKKFKEEIDIATRNGATAQIHQQLTPAQREQIRVHLQSINDEHAENWHAFYSMREVCEILLASLPANKIGAVRSLLEEIKLVTLVVSADTDQWARDFSDAVINLVYGKGLSFQTWNLTEQKSLLEHWKECLFKDQRNAKLASELKDAVFKQGKHKDVSHCLTAIQKAARETIGILQKAARMGMTMSSTVPRTDEPHNHRNGDRKKGNKQKRDEHKKHDRTHETATNGGSSSPQFHCKKCGWKDKCKHGKCEFWGHPNINKSDTPWISSKWGELYSKTTSPREKLHPTRKILDNGTVQSLSDAELEQIKKLKSKVNHISDLAINHMLNYVTNKDSYNPFVSAKVANTDIEIGNGLLDTGSLGEIGNYVDSSVYNLVNHKSRLDPSTKCSSTKVCSINNCFTNSHCIKLDVELYNSTGKRVTITMVARVVQDLPYKLIVGFKTIREYRLTRVFDDIFTDSSISSADILAEPILQR